MRYLTDPHFFSLLTKPEKKFLEGIAADFSDPATKNDAARKLQNKTKINAGLAFPLMDVADEMAEQGQTEIALTLYHTVMCHAPKGAKIRDEAGGQILNLLPRAERDKGAAFAARYAREVALYRPNAKNIAGEQADQRWSEITQRIHEPTARAAEIVSAKESASDLLPASSRFLALITQTAKTMLEFDATLAKAIQHKTLAHG